MGMFAEVIAIGPFTKALIKNLEYSADRYATTLEGAVVTTTLFGIVEGNSLSGELATALGISDAWDFNQHKIKTKNIDFDTLNSIGQRYSRYAEDVSTLRVLSEYGFEFHFAPNG